MTIKKSVTVLLFMAVLLLPVAFIVFGNQLQSTRLQINYSSDSQSKDSPRNYSKYKFLLKDIYNNPDKYVSNDRYIGYNKFSIKDINGDGTEDLIVQITQAGTSDQKTLIWTLDLNNRISQFNIRESQSEYFSNGMMKVRSTFNQTNSDFWPYELYKFNQETGIYDYIGKYYANEEGTVKSYNPSSNLEGINRVYYFEASDGTTTSLTQSDYEARVKQETNPDDQIETEFIDLTLDNINKAEYTK